VPREIILVQVAICMAPAADEAVVTTEFTSRVILLIDCTICTSTLVASAFAILQVN
jgi:hypothetical protein